MSILKFSKISFVLILFFVLQLGACAKEAPAVNAQETASAEVDQTFQKLSDEKLVQPEVQMVQEEVVEQEPVKDEVIKDEELKEEISSPSQAAKNVEQVAQEIIQAEPETIKEKIVIAATDLPTQPPVTVDEDVVLEVEEKTAAQSMLNLEQYRGKVVYLDFWASWCVPCQQTFPWMDAMQKKYPDDIVFVAVNFGESPDDTQEFLKRFPADIKFIYDPLVQIASEYGVPGLPYSFIYGRKGELLGKHAGFSGGSEINLEAALKNLFESGE